MVRDLVSVLAEHGEDPAYADTCICEVSIPDADEVEGHYVAHLAAVIEAEVIRPREREAWNEGAWATAERWDTAPARTNPFAEEVE